MFFLIICQQILYIVVMANLANPYRDRHIVNLAQENEELRRKIAKLTEIESYVELLVDKLEKAERKEQVLGSENGLLRQQIRQLEGKFSQSQNIHGQEMRYVFSQHDQLVEEKNAALAHLKAVADKESARSAQLDAQILALSQREQHRVTEYEDKLVVMRVKLDEMERDLQAIYQALQHEKMTHGQTKESWNADQRQLRAALNDQSLLAKQRSEEAESLALALNRSEDELRRVAEHSRKEADSLNGALRRAENEAQRLAEYGRNLEVTMAKKDDDNVRAISELQNSSAMLRGQIERLNSECHSLQVTKADNQRTIEELRATQARLRGDNETYVTDNQRLIFLLEQAQKENAFIREKQQEVEDYSSVEIEKAKIENVRLREENNVMAKNGSEREQLLGTKMLELKETTIMRNSLQAGLDQAQGQINALSTELRTITDILREQRDRGQELSATNHKLQQALSLSRQECLNIEEVNQRIKLEVSELSEQNHLYQRQLKNPRELNKQYTDQIDRMLKNFHEEREQENRRHNMEKEKLREVFGYEMKEKELEFARRLGELEEEILRTKRLEVLAERSNRKGKV